MRRCFIALGCNLGDCPRQLRRAAQALAGAEGVQVVALSSFYESDPVGVADQPGFLNAVLEARAALSPEELLALLKRIEQELGRRPRYRWGPREIDLDLLWYEGETRREANLTLPHPRWHERAFVLLPWAELAADLEVEPGRQVRQQLDAIDLAGCRPWQANDRRDQDADLQLSG